MVTCASCGKERKANSTICPHCGIRRERCGRHGIEKRLNGCPICAIEKTANDGTVDRHTFQLRG